MLCHVNVVAILVVLLLPRNDLCLSDLPNRYMEQVTTIKFVREAHIKKFNKLMKFDLPGQLESLR